MLGGHDSPGKPEQPRQVPGWLARKLERKRLRNVHRTNIVVMVGKPDSPECPVTVSATVADVAA